MFQFNCLLLLLLGIGINYYVILLPSASFQFPIVFSILILLFCLGLNYWVFFTSSGKAYARKYNGKQAKQAENQRKYLEKLKNQPLVEKAERERLEKEKEELFQKERQENLDLFFIEGRKSMTQLKVQFDENIANEILKKFETTYCYCPLHEFYESALDLIVIYSGDPKVKLFALKVGRLHFKRQNFWQETSTHDEQTIQNDINARC